MIVFWRLVNPGGASDGAVECMCGEGGSETAVAGAPSTIDKETLQWRSSRRNLQTISVLRELWQLRLSYIRLITFTCRDTHVMYTVTYTHMYIYHVHTNTPSHSNIDLNQQYSTIYLIHK